jgi:hypothetical protein
MARGRRGGPPAPGASLSDRIRKKQDEDRLAVRRSSSFLVCLDWRAPEADVTRSRR